MLINHRLSSYWKEAVIQRIPKKNFTIEDLSTQRDISLLPVCCKILSKAICNRIISIISSKINFWQRAFLNKRDRLELIYTLKTAFDDFRHKSTKFTSVFIDFADAFGSVNHQFLFETLQYFDVPDIYSCLIEDLYKYSSFKVICGSNLTKIFIIVRGTKTGDPLSALIFILIIERTCRPMVEIAILKLGIRNELRFNPLPVQAFADDIVLSSYDIEVIKSMLRESEPVMLSAGLEVKPSKCAIFHDRSSGSNWYKSRKNYSSEVFIQSHSLPLCKLDINYKYFGKSLSLCGEDEKQFDEFINKYQTLVDQIKLSVLPISVKCSAFNNLALAKIYIIFTTQDYLKFILI